MPDLDRGRLAVRHDPRPLNPNGWAILSNEQIHRWSGAKRADGPHAGLYAHPFKSWDSAVQRAHKEGVRRHQLAELFCTWLEDCPSEFHHNGCYSCQRVDG